MDVDGAGIDVLITLHDAIIAQPVLLFDPGTFNTFWCADAIDGVSPG